MCQKRSKNWYLHLFGLKRIRYSLVLETPTSNFSLTLNPLYPYKFRFQRQSSAKSYSSAMPTINFAFGIGNYFNFTFNLQLGSASPTQAEPARHRVSLIHLPVLLIRWIPHLFQYLLSRSMSF